MVKRRHTPLRTCVVCRAKRPKAELMRLTVGGERLVVVDRLQRLPGRGAYVCVGCLSRLKWDRRLQRSFRQRADGLQADQGLSTQSRGFKVQGPVPGPLLTCASHLTAII